MGILQDKMIAEMKIRGLSPKTITAYIRSMKTFTKYFNTSPDQLSLDDIHRYQLYLVNERKVKWTTFNHAVSALRFFYNKVLKKNGILISCPFIKKVFFFQPS